MINLYAFLKAIQMNDESKFSFTYLLVTISKAGDDAPIFKKVKIIDFNIFL